MSLELSTNSILPFFSISNDMQVEIFKHLSSKEKEVCAQVCKQFRIIAECWQTLLNDFEKGNKLSPRQFFLLIKNNEISKERRDRIIDFFNKKTNSNIQDIKFRVDSTFMIDESKQQLPWISSVLEFGIKISIEDLNVLLRSAAGYGDVKAIESFVKAGANINLCVANGYGCSTPLHAAILRKKIDAVKKLIELGADPMQLNIAGSGNGGRNAENWARYCECFEIAKYLSQITKK